MKAKIKTKISLLVLSSLMILGLAMGALTIYELFTLGDKNISSFDRKLREDFDRMSKHQVELALSIVKDLYSQQNDLGIDESKRVARDLIDNMSYGNDGYIFIYDSKGISIATPDEVEGTNRWNLQDSEGSYFLQEIIKSALDNTNYTSYLFNRPGESEATPKRSYSVYFQPWDWIIGTGNYIDDIDEIIANERDNTLLIINRIIRIVVTLDIMIIFLAFIVALIMGKRFAKPIEVLSLEVESIASGDADLTVSVDIASSDEIGVLSESFNLFIRKLRNQVNEIKTAMVKTEQIKDDMASSTVETSAAVEEIQANLDSITQQFGSLNDKISGNNTVTQKISANIETVDTQILDQAAMVEESTAAITEMIASIKNVAHITSNKKEATKALDAMANESRVRIEDTQKAFATVNSMMASIHEMANSINDIARQICSQ
jgi:methyl-accepting chemotaxis protein